MRVLIAPDKFAGTLTAVEAAAAVEQGWRRQRPDDVLSTIPMADGGPGFADALHASLGGSLHALTVPGPLGRPTPATLLLTTGDGGEQAAYVESAQACGLALLPRDERDRPQQDVAEQASTSGVGEIVREALLAGATTVVVGLGGSGTNDGGAGLLAALGATCEPPGALTAGAAGLATLTDIDIAPARRLLAGRTLVAATDVSNPLLGLRGATNVYGPQKGLSRERLLAVDASLTRLADLLDRSVADQPGAGAAGGLGYALALLGAQRRPGGHRGGQPRPADVHRQGRRRGGPAMRSRRGAVRGRGRTPRRRLPRAEGGRGRRRVLDGRPAGGAGVSAASSAVAGHAGRAGGAHVGTLTVASGPLLRGGREAARWAARCRR